jgi:hypothetical protein
MVFAEPPSTDNDSAGIIILRILPLRPYYSICGLEWTIVHCTSFVLCEQYQSPSFKGEPRDLRRRTEIMPVKDSHTRIKPLTLASGHGRYIC